MFYWDYELENCQTRYCRIRLAQVYPFYICLHVYIIVYIIYATYPSPLHPFNKASYHLSHPTIFARNYSKFQALRQLRVQREAVSMDPPEGPAPSSARLAELVASLKSHAEDTRNKNAVYHNYFSPGK